MQYLSQTVEKTVFVTQCYSGVISGCYRTKSSSSPPPMPQGTRPLPWATLESIDHHTRNYCHLVKSIIFFFSILLSFHFLRKLEKILVPVSCNFTLSL